MKRLLFATIMLLAFIACDEDEVVGWEDYVIWDISPIEFRILVLDENGNDLITDKENSDVLQGLKLWYNNECYLLEDGESVMVTRYYMPTFYPLQILPYTSTSLKLPSSFKGMLPWNKRFPLYTL